MPRNRIMPQADEHTPTATKRQTLSYIAGGHKIGEDIYKYALGIGEADPFAHMGDFPGRNRLGDVIRREGTYGIIGEDLVVVAYRLSDSESILKIMEKKAYEQMLESE